MRAELIEIVQALGVIYELLGQEVSASVLTTLAEDLEPYGVSHVLRGLDLARRELPGRITPALLVEKIQQAAGRPGVGEAWAIAIGAADERCTVVWTDEIAAAWLAAKPLYGMDNFGARRAFDEAYARETRNAIGGCRPVRWKASIGWDSDAREKALTQALDRGLLTFAAVARFLPAPPASGVGDDVSRLLAGKTVVETAIDEAAMNEQRRARLGDARRAIYSARDRAAQEAARQRAEFEMQKREMIERALQHPLAAKV